MGQYLYIGLCYKVKISRKLIADHKISESELLQGMTNMLDCILYSRQDTENELVFVLNHEEIKQNLSEFLAKQIQFFKQSKFNSEHAQRTLNAIDKCATAAEILEIANTKNVRNLQILDLPDSLRVGRWNNYLEIHISLLTFETVGKIFMEEYKDFLTYLVNLIRCTSEGNPLAGAVYATIS
ncbi:hypothetical protein E4K67_14735 [Desulfosporosinus fructosivorans]|uniref:Uncharacterized protein n=1 Tax=Desulfosporosinus fructosivorans TaxID=2018669 RepID=A0A4Z0R266_9FIRM|nr:hypothetical protein [Desulfosporosinus fructosivorans]TGE37141.1 hypothetical protein E4K67_14735 [Desulfosporosinus fructosivorans]